MKLKGFTIIELLISIFILTIGITAVIYIFPFGTQVQKSSQMATAAVQLSQEKIEEIISKTYSEILTGVIEEDYGFNVNLSSFKRKTEISYFDLEIKKIEVTVFWRTSFGVDEKEVKLTTLIAKK